MQICAVVTSLKYTSRINARTKAYYYAWYIAMWYVVIARIGRGPTRAPPSAVYTFPIGQLEISVLSKIPDIRYH